MAGRPVTDINVIYGCLLDKLGVCVLSMALPLSSVTYHIDINKQVVVYVYCVVNVDVTTTLLLNKQITPTTN